jgi:hypothetical protein
VFRHAPFSQVDPAGHVPAVPHVASELTTHAVPSFV